MLTVAAFLVAISILVAVHEYGHYRVARLLGVKVLRFSIGFGPSLWTWREAGGGTEYLISAIPLGGYVQMLDEREGPVPEAEQHRAFNRQALWRRGAIVLAGPAFNLLFAVVAFWLIYVTGVTGLRPVVGEVEAGKAADVAGFVPGEEWLRIAGKPTPTWESVIYSLMAASIDGTMVRVEARGPSGEPLEHWLEVGQLLAHADRADFLANIGIEPLRPRLLPVIGEVVAGGAAERDGLRHGDRILTVNGQLVTDWPDWVERVRAAPGLSLQVVVQRAGAHLELRLTPDALEQEGKVQGRIGAGPEVPEDFFTDLQVSWREGPVDALGIALDKTLDLSLLTLRVLWKTLKGEVSLYHLSGPISIAETAGKTAQYGLEPFIKFLAVISISLGIINLLPIPVLDGGHLLFLLLEGLRGRPLTDPQLEGLQRVGLVLVGGLMLLALYMDLQRLLE